MATVRAGSQMTSLARVDAWRRRTTEPSPALVDVDDRRRAALLANVALALALLLSVSTVVSACTTILFPDPDVSLGWDGTAVVGLAAVAFSASLVLARRPAFEIGAWVTILTIDAFLLGLGLLYPEYGRSLALGFAVPVVCATILLRARGTIAVFLLSGVLGTLHLILGDVTLVDAGFIIGIMVAVTVLTVVIALIREGDLEQVVRLRQLERAEAERLRGELELARRVQLAMLPDALPDIVGLDLAAFSEPAFEASGDFYDVFAVEGPAGPGTSIGIVVADVAGKGVASALVMSATWAVLRSEAERAASPGALLAKVNETLAKSVPPGLFVTLCYAIFDPSTRALRFASAGHPHPFRWSQRVAAVDELESYGMPLGLLAGSEYVDEVTVLHAGDVVAFFTDGLVEALDGARDMYGFDRARDDFLALARRPGTAADRCDGVLAAMRAFVGDERLHDDVTVVTMAIPDVVDLDTLTTTTSGSDRVAWTTDR
jgi:serine phosphatase RsbU (regulator of sigma subunit)